MTNQDSLENLTDQITTTINTIGAGPRHRAIIQAARDALELALISDLDESTKLSLLQETIEILDIHTRNEINQQQIAEIIRTAENSIARTQNQRDTLKYLKITTPALHLRLFRSLQALERASVELSRATNTN